MCLIRIVDQTKVREAQGSFFRSIYPRASVLVLTCCRDNVGISCRTMCLSTARAKTAVPEWPGDEVKLVKGKLGRGALGTFVRRR